MAYKAKIYGMPDFVYDYRMDQQKRARLIDQEMSEQAKIIDDLRHVLIFTFCLPV